MKFFLLWVTSISILLPSIALSDQFNGYGLIKDGSGSFDTSSERVYEYGDGNNKHWNYCIHAATAGALNIRLGKQKVTLEGMHSAFSLFGGYGDKDNRLASLSYVRQLSFSDGKIPDMKAILRTVPYNDEDALYQKIKDAVKYNNPVVVAATGYSPVENSGKTSSEKGFSAVRKFNYYNVGHGLLITGYIELDSEDSNKNLIMVRDPFIKEPLGGSRYKQYYDYTIPIEILKKLIQNSNGSYHLMLFKTKLNANLKMLVPDASNSVQPGDSCGSNKVYDCVMTCVNASTASSWSKDRACDDGSWKSNGVYYTLTCPAFDNDNGACN